MLLKDVFFVYGCVILNPDDNNLISINEEQTHIKSCWDNFIFLKKKKKKLEQTRQNKPQKGKLLEQNRRALLRLFRARLVNRPVSLQRSLVLKNSQYKSTLAFM